MSYSTLYGLWPNTERRRPLATLHNSWGSAPFVWNLMARRYLGCGPHEWMRFMMENDDSLWRLHERQDVPAGDRAVLRMTFDLRYVLFTDRVRAINDIALFLHGMKDLIEPSAANHWPKIADLFVTRYEDQPPAFGIHHTSVSENPWDDVDWTQASSVYEGL